jgi:hypothetical protein
MTHSNEPGPLLHLETRAACEKMVRSIGAGRTVTRAELEAER